MSGIVNSEQPNNRLYNYDGTLTMTDHATGGGRPKDYPLDPSMLLLRGAQLRNTSWIYGLVVFTGHETKLMLNSSKKPTKASNVTRITNRNILYLFAMLVTMSVLCSLGSYAISVSWGFLGFCKYSNNYATEKRCRYQRLYNDSLRRAGKGIWP